MRSETETLKSERDYANAEQRSRVLDIVVREVKKFGTLFLYLALVFGLFTLHQWVVLANNHISYAFYGASVINALILAKIMLVAEAFQRSRIVTFSTRRSDADFTLQQSGAHTLLARRCDLSGRRNHRPSAGN